MLVIVSAYSLVASRCFLLPLVFGVSSDEYLNYAEQNRKEWERRGREVVAELLASVQEEEESEGDDDGDKLKSETSGSFEDTTQDADSSSTMSSSKH